MKNTTNVFLKGMQSDKHPLTTSQQEYTEAMNATLVTFNGNEQMLQNDMGNTRIQDAKTGNIMGLREGFTPVGLEEHGGIMYIASVNKEGVGEIGTIPSPIIKYTLNENQNQDNLIQKLPLDFLDKESPAVRVSEKVLYPEDKFLISIDEDNGPKIAKEVNIESYIEDSTGNIRKNSITYPYISKNKEIQGELIYKKGRYKLNLYAQTKNNTICLNDIVNDLNIIYYNDIKEDFRKHYFFVIDNFSDSNVNLDKMIKEDGNTNIDYFLHYPCIAPGKIAISSEPESIESFSLIENFTNKANGKGQIYPITLMDSSEVPVYYSAIQGFKYTTDSAAHVDMIRIYINGDNPQDIYVENDKVSRYQLSETEFLICRKTENHSLYKEYKNNSNNQILIKRDYGDNIVNDYLYVFRLGENLNQNINLKVEYFDTTLYESPDQYKPLGTYHLNYNPYYFDQAKQYLTTVYWQPHIFSTGSSSFSMARDQSKNLKDVIEIDSYSGGDRTISQKKTSNSEEICFGKARDDKDKWIEVQSYNGGAQYVIESSTIRVSGKSTASNFGESSYLKLTLNNNIISQGNIEVTDINFQINIVTEAGHNKGKFWNEGTPKVKLDAKLTYRDTSFTNTPTLTGERYSNQDDNNKGYLKFNSGSIVVDNDELRKKITEDLSKNTMQNIIVNLTNLEQQQICRIFPDGMYGNGLYANIDVTVHITYKISGASGVYECNNLSSLVMTPQYDLYGLLSDGFTEEEVPVYYDKEKESFTPSSVYSQNLINLSKYTRTNKDYKKSAILYNGILGPLDIRSLYINIPDPSKYALIAEPDRKFIYDGSQYNFKIIYGSPQEIKIDKLSTDDDFPNIGLYKVLDQNISDKSTIIKQSCICFSEGDDPDPNPGITDYWIDYVMSSGSLGAVPIYSRTFKYKQPAEQTNQTIYETSKKRSYDAPTIKGKQSLTFY